MQQENTGALTIRLLCRNTASPNTLGGTALP
jgi:hypothetical protein